MTMQRTQRTRTPHVAAVRERPPSDTQVRYLALSNTTNRQTLVTPSAGKAVRLLHVTIVTQGAGARVLAELYFGAGGDITVNPKKVIDLLGVPENSSAETRIYTRGQGPRGAINDVVSVRYQVAPTNSHYAVIEYTEEP